MTPRSSLEHFNAPLVTAEDHLASTKTCYSNNLTERLFAPQERDKTTEMVQADEAEQKHIPGKPTKQREIQLDEEKNEAQNDALVKNQHISAIVAEADDDELAGGKNAEANAESLSKQKTDQDNNRGASPQNMTIESISLEQAGKEDTKRNVRHFHQAQMYSSLFRRWYADLYASLRVKVKDPRHELVGARHRSVAGCKGTKLCERKAANAVSGRSTIRETRTAVDWKRRKKREARSDRLNMAS